MHKRGGLKDGEQPTNKLSWYTPYYDIPWLVHSDLPLRPKYAKHPFNSECRSCRQAPDSSLRSPFSNARGLHSIPQGSFAYAPGPEYVPVLLTGSSFLTPCTNIRQPHLPRDWSLKLHPDGHAYYYRDSPPLPVTTQADMTSQLIQDRMSHWIGIVAKMLLELPITLPDSTELVLELPYHSTNTCAYYFVNHRTHSVFWMEDVDIKVLGFSSPIPFSSLRKPSQPHQF